MVVPRARGMGISYEEKLENLESTVFGISYHDSKNDNGELVRNCKIVSSVSDNLEYEISLLTTEGESRKIQGFADNISFSIVPEEHGIITIKYRVSNSLDEIRTVHISI